MDSFDASTLSILKALANPNRLNILFWISDPVAHFPVQRDGDLIKDGVCVGFITQKINLSQPTVTAHMQILTDAGLVTGKRIKNWVFYKPNKSNFENALNTLITEVTTTST